MLEFKSQKKTDGEKIIILRIYLDNCCFNRPYDDQTYLRVYLETQAKIHIQGKIKNGELELVTSYILVYENFMSPFKSQKSAIDNFLRSYSSYHVGAEKADKIAHIAKSIMATGVKMKDAHHLACALEAECKYFLSTDDRLLKKYKSDTILLLNPVDFVMYYDYDDGGL
ncbi:MAG: hypothetical protein IJP48_03695 [Synergistaceae bacterium]|nr:hypothetical protein [Synergistaceae bacterium]